ncbi:MAG: radical SAM protein [Peptococcaceae bacterium]|nr:radical SAM protein [Peptococcaceae bacterium]
MEVTSHCNARCVYCPRTVFGDRWLNRNMPVATFSKMLPYFRRTGLVFLQGWGEPLLHPDFFSMVAMAGKEGCRVGTTTNGMLVNQKTAKQIVSSGIDVIAISLAGTGGKNDLIRAGTALEKVLHAIRLIDREKKRVGSHKPAVNIAYMLLRSGLDELPGLPGLLAGLGVNQVVISTLDYVPSPSLENETLIPRENGQLQRLTAVIDHTVTKGREAGLDIHCQARYGGRRRQVCTENVMRAVFVSAGGEVSPCAYAAIPVRDESSAGGIPGGLIFGNVTIRDLALIWNGRRKIMAPRR